MMPSTDGPSGTRAGFVALVGAPNVGKSTLMNRLVGERLSIVTPKAQTTWRKVPGILTIGDAQLVLVDTPGLLAPKDLLQRALLIQAREALKDADRILLILDGTRTLGRDQEAALEDLRSEARVPILVAINKVDAATPGSLEQLGRWATEFSDSRVHRISAETGEGIEELLEELVEGLPTSPFFYPADEVAVDPVRFFVGEMVRESVFELYEQEIPYGVFTQVEEFRQGGDGRRTYIHVIIYTERKSQKGILIGEGGRAIRKLGTHARAKIEHFVGEPVYLELWVKVLPNWKKKRAALGRFGFTVPEDDDRP